MKSEIGKYLRGAWWCLWVAVVPVGAQQVRKLSLTEAIEIAKRDSYAAQVARYSFWDSTGTTVLTGRNCCPR